MEPADQLPTNEAEEPPPLAQEMNGRLLPAGGLLSRRVASFALITALVLLGIWILKMFLVPFFWATVMAIATWPIYDKFRQLVPFRDRARVVAPLVATLLIGLVFLVPLTLGALQFGRELVRAVHGLVSAESHGVPIPPWIPALPIVGPAIADWWKNNLGDPHPLAEMFGRVDREFVIGWTGALGRQILARSLDLVFTLLTLFFLYRDGSALARGLIILADRTVGSTGKRIGAHMIAAVRSTVNGLVVVGLGEGVVLGLVYAAFGLPQWVLLGTMTGILAAIPLGAGVVFTGCSLYLLAHGSVTAAIALFAIGTVVVSIADHFVRPIVISGSIQLPFFWVLLGIIGGLESIGLVGLFLGPAVIAALIALWRELEAPPADTGD